MDQLSFQYPSWYILLCLLLGLAFAIGLYYRDKTFKTMSSLLNWGLGSLRFLLATILSILLLSPFLKSFQTQTQKPIVVIAQDASESIKADFSAEELTAYTRELEETAKALEGDYEVQRYAFGERVRKGFDFNFTDKVTNTSELIKNINDLYSTENLGAIVLATDGIYNEGSNPLYLNTNFTAPIFTVALGDTTEKKDLMLKRTFLNRIAYLGDQFVVQIDIAATNLTGRATSLSIFRVSRQGTQKLEEKVVNITSDDFFQTEEFVLNADKSGVQRYRIILSQIDGESTTANNARDVFIDVLDARQKILVLGHAPHPDLTAIKQTITENKNYQLDVSLVKDFKGQLKAYDFVILHQLPSARYNIAAILNTLSEEKIPHFFIVGSQTDLSNFNSAQSLLSIRGDGRNFDEVSGKVAPGFTLFTLSEEISNNIVNFAPLIAPFGDYQTDGAAQVLLYQRIGKIDMTNRPLLLFGDDRGTKIGILTGEGIWKWRLFDFLQNETHDIINELLGKTVQYVSVKEDKRRFRVNPEKNIFNENENVLFNAELYNSSYELVNDPDVDIAITDAEGKEYDYIFDKTEKAYLLDAGILPVGNYRFRSTVSYNGEQLTASGQFSIQPVQLELFETTADHNMLRLLSNKYGGKLVSKENVGTVAQQIKDTETIKPVMYQTARTQSLINLKWVFFLLLTLLALEWVLRRYYGGY